MKDHPVIYGSRAEFTQRFGFSAPEDWIGICFCTDVTRQNIVFEFIFTDVDEPTDGDKLDIAELERMYALNEPRNPLTEEFCKRYGLERT